MISSAVKFRENIWAENEYNYAAAYGFKPNIHAYLHDDDTVRPAMLVIPGGGYCMVCHVEGEVVAEEFYDRGMNVFVLTYTTDITMSVPLRKQPLLDAARAVRYLRSNAERFKLDGNRLTICGFSAGGHLCATLATHFDDAKDPSLKMDAISCRPDSVILGYPVITSGEFTHIYSIQALTGYNASDDELDYFSLEKQVSPDTPPCFVWQTVEDDLVPVENSMFFAEALRKNKVPYAYYAFPHGRHGLSAWNDRVKADDFGEPYTYEQLDAAVAAVKNHTAVDVSEKRRTELMMQFFGNPEGLTKEEQAALQGSSTDTAADAPKKDTDTKEPALKKSPVPDYPDVSMWPELAAVWLKSLDLI